jgi:hypothetical protein
VIATTPIPEAHPMLLVDCPFCDAPAPLAAEADAVDCPVCAVRVELAADEPAMLELAVAA